jgi:Methyltransferase domain
MLPSIKRLSSKTLVLLGTVVGVILIAVGIVVASLAQDLTFLVIALLVVAIEATAIGVLLVRIGLITMSVSTRWQTAIDTNALLQLYQNFSPTSPMPSPGGVAATPRTLYYLASVASEIPAGHTVVECGSGISTLWTGLALKKSGRNVRLISLEHLEVYAEETRRNVDALGLSDIVEVRVAPLTEQAINGVPYQWYAADALTDVRNVALLFVDGPPGTVGRDARFPAVPLLAAALDDGARIVLDDTDRKHEQEIADNWMASAWSGATLRKLTATDRSTVFEFSRSGT